MPAPFIDILAIINLLGIVQGIFLAFIFFSASGNNRFSHFLLGLLLFLLALDAFEIWLSYTNYIAYVPFLINLAEPFAFLYAPLHYLYTLSVIKPEFRLQKKHSFYLVPFLLYIMYRFPFYLQSNAFKLSDVAQSFNRSYSTDFQVESILWFPPSFFSGKVLDALVFVWSIIFLALLFYQIHRYVRSHHTSIFSTTNSTLKWIVRAAIYIGCIFLIFALLALFTQKDVGDIYISTAMSLVFYCMNVHVITQSSLLLPKKEKVVELRKKYEKSTLRTEATQELIKKLINYMEGQKPYLNSEFSLPELASYLSLSTHHLSQLINEQLNQNFFDFTNSYRIEEAKRRLHDPKLTHIKIEEIAFECGFNSKSAFNAAFKKFTQITPSQFRKEMQVP